MKWGKQKIKRFSYQGCIKVKTAWEALVRLRLPVTIYLMGGSLLLNSKSSHTGNIFSAASSLYLKKWIHDKTSSAGWRWHLIIGLKFFGGIKKFWGFKNLGLNICLVEKKLRQNFRPRFWCPKVFEVPRNLGEKILSNNFKSKTCKSQNFGSEKN